MSLVQGVDSTGKIIPLLVDASGRAIVVGADNSIFSPVANFASVTNTDLAAGTNNITILTVPASQRYRVTMFSYSYTGTVAAVYLDPSVKRGSTNYYFGEVNPVVSGKLYTVYFDLTLEASDLLQLSIFGATLHDDMQAYAFYTRIL